MDIQLTYTTALQHHQAGQLAQAEALYRSILASKPKHADAWHYLGVIYHQTGRHHEAVQTIAHAITLNPNDADYWSNQGLALKALTQLKEAINSFKQALKLAPDDLDIQYNLGNACVEAEQFEAAANAYRRVLREYPHDQDLKAALSHVLQALGHEQQQAGRYLNAQACYQEAITLQPNEASLYYNLGNAQRELGKPQQAASQYQSAIRLNPQDADAYNNLGNVQRELGELQAAMDSYQNALRLNPTLYHAKVHLVHQKQHACDWDGLETDIETIRNWVQNQDQAQISPFAFLAMPNTKALEQKQCANNWLKNRYQSAFSQGSALNFQYAKSHQKLRIGYLSADFRLHPLASLISELIELHDRNAFEIHAYSYGINDESTERKRLAQAFDCFNDVRELSPVDAAKKINADAIDILVDLTGFTQTSRSQIVAMRPAPISVSWLGFPGTMGEINGKPLFDYLLSDAFITPPETASNYAEKLVLLNCYQPNDRERPIVAAKTRAEYGLPSDGFVFCSFNQSFKILPNMFDIWMRLLKQTPNAVLWLIECNQLAKTNLRKEAQARGVAPERLIFAPRLSMAEHLARQTCADLFLDTLPYNAHTTTSDALWMGLPVLTCVGDTFAARVAGSLLQAAELPELITYTLAEYEAKALELANQPQMLQAIKNHLLNNKNELPLFNSEQFVRNLEKAYHLMRQA